MCHPQHQLVSVSANFARKNWFLGTKNDSNCNHVFWKDYIERLAGRESSSVHDQWIFSRQLIIKALPGSVWVQIEPAAVEVDRRLEVLGIPEATRHALDLLNLAVEQRRLRLVGQPRPFLKWCLAGC